MRDKYAVPELILGIGWLVREGEGSTSPAERIFCVPLGEDATSVAVRAHELAHVRFSPKDPKKVLQQYAESGGEPLALAAVEDVRVNLLASARGVDLSELYPERILSEFEASLPSEIDRQEGLRLALMAFVLLSQREICSRAGKTALEERISGLLLKISSLIGLHRFLSLIRIFQDFSSSSLSFKMAKSCARGIESLFPKRLDAEPLPTLELPIPSLLASPSPQSTVTDDTDYIGQPSRSLIRPGVYHPDAGWMPMQVRFYPLVRSARSAPLTRRASDFGSLRFPHRIPPIGDGLVFGSSRRRSLPPGGVLIDDSGSMAISKSDLLQLVYLASSYGVVAKYSAGNLTGTLAVLVYNGRMASAGDVTRRLGPTNGIDGPALRWLIEHARPPYVWVSDTYVTGKHEFYSDDLLKQCLEIVSRHQVKVLTSVEQALQYFKCKPMR